MAIAQTLQTENRFIQTKKWMQKASLRKGDYLLFSLVILLQLQPSPCKARELTISSLLPFCSNKEDILCSSLLRFTSALLLQPFKVYQESYESSKSKHLAACSYMLWMLRGVVGTSSQLSHISSLDLACRGHRYMWAEAKSALTTPSHSK